MRTILGQDVPESFGELREMAGIIAGSQATIEDVVHLEVIAMGLVSVIEVLARLAKDPKGHAFIEKSGF